MQPESKRQPQDGTVQKLKEEIAKIKRQKQVNILLMNVMYWLIYKL